MRHPLTAATIILCSPLIKADARAATIFVNASLTTGAANGTSWADAYRGRLGLKLALAAAQPGDELWVAQGTYAPAAANGPITDAFNLSPGLTLLGGFVGTESAASQRNPAANTTILTGDLNANGSPGADNTFHVAIIPDAPGTLILDGFTITGGFAGFRAGGAAPDIFSGAGLLILGGTNVIQNCRFLTNHSAASGGGIAVLAGSTTIESCAFSQNMAENGTGIANLGSSSTTVRACTFTDSGFPNGSTRGVGISSGRDLNGGPQPSTLVVENCLFSIQAAPFLAMDGVGIFVGGGTADIRACRFINCTSGGSGGGVSASDSTVRIDRCRFIGNEGRGDGGAAIYSFQSAAITVTNSIFAGNDREGFSTIHVQGGSSITLANCTIFDNGTTTAFHRAFLIGMNATASVRNAIMRANKTSGQLAAATAILFGGGTISFDSCCIDGWSNQFPGVLTFAADPQFINPAGPDGLTGTADDDLRLVSASPCIDRGNNAFLPAGLTLDISNSPRFRDIASVPDLGPGPAPVIDLGAHETAPTCPADFNGDGAVNTSDLTFLLGLFGQPLPPFAPGDTNGDGAINTIDLTSLLGAFGSPCP